MKPRSGKEHTKKYRLGQTCIFWYVLYHVLVLGEHLHFYHATFQGLHKKDDGMDNGISF